MHLCPRPSESRPLLSSNTVLHDSDAAHPTTIPLIAPFCAVHIVNPHSGIASLHRNLVVRLVVRIPATLLGIFESADHRARCTLEVWNERSYNGRQFTRCRIIDDRPELPGGTYAVQFAGHTLPTSKANGKWDLICVAPQIFSVDPK